MRWLLLGAVLLSLVVGGVLLCLVVANRGIAEEERKHGLN